MPPKKKQKTLSKKEIRLRDEKRGRYGDAIKDAQGGVASPEPTDPKKLEDWDWSNVGLFTGTEFPLEDLLTREKFLLKGGKGSPGARTELWSYMKGKIEAYAAAPVEAARLAEKAADEARFRAAGEWLGDLDEDQQVAKLYDGSDSLTMLFDPFLKRGGTQPAWRKAMELSRAKIVKKADEDGALRASTRVVTRPDWLQPGANDNNGKAPWSHPECGPEYWHDDNPADEHPIACVEVGMGGAEKLENLGVAVAGAMLKTEASNETWQRGKQDTVSRCLTNAARTFQLRTWLAKLASERHWRRLAAGRLAARRDVVALGDATNDDSLSERARLCGAARADADASLLDASVAAGGDDTLMEDVSRPSGQLFTTLLEAGADVNNSSDVVEPRLDPGAPGFISQVVRDAEATPRTSDAAAALDALPRSHTPTGRLGEILEEFELMRYDPTSDECVGGPAYERMRAAHARKRKKTRTGGGVCEFYLHKVLLLALERAFVAGRLKFDKMALTLYYCVFGRYFWAEKFWSAGFTMLDALRLGLPLDWIPMEVRVADLPLLPRWVQRDFPNGIAIASSAVVLELCQATNQAFFDNGKCALWVLAHAAYYGDSHPLTLAALADVGGGSDENVAPRVAACEQALAAHGFAVPSAVSGCVSLAVGDSDALAPATLAAPAPVYSSRKDALAAATRPFKIEISFAKPATTDGTKRWTQFHQVDDFLPALAALWRHATWSAVASSQESWVRQSDLVRVMEIGAQLVFAGLDIEDIAPPHSLLHVFDPKYQCKRDQTYTIWTGVDFNVRMPDGRVFSKSEFLKEVMKKHAAAAAA